MSTIPRLPTRTMSAGDLIPFYSSNNSDDAKASISALAALIQTINGTDSNKVTQYESPEDSFDITVDSVTKNTWLILSPTGGASPYTGTVNLPAASSAFDRMEVSISTNEDAEITMASTGATVISEPYGLESGGSVTYRYEAILKRWYVVAIYRTLSLS